MAASLRLPTIAYWNVSVRTLMLVKNRRTHQIRVHMTHVGYPLVGDPLYAGRFQILPALPSPTLVQTLKELPPGPACALPRADSSDYRAAHEVAIGTAR